MQLTRRSEIHALKKIELLTGLMMISVTMLFISIAVDKDPYTDPYEILFILLLIYLPLSILAILLARGKGKRVIPWIMTSISAILMALLMLTILIQYAVVGIHHSDSSLHVSSLFLPVIIFMFILPEVYTLLVLYIMGYVKNSTDKKAVHEIKKGDGEIPVQNTKREDL